jgi:hypothetical protein
MKITGYGSRAIRFYDEEERDRNWCSKENPFATP